MTAIGDEPQVLAYADPKACHEARLLPVSQVGASCRLPGQQRRRPGEEVDGADCADAGVQRKCPNVGLTNNWLPSSR